MILTSTSGSGFTQCFTCPHTCPTNYDCAFCHMMTMSMGSIQEKHVSETPLPKKEKLKKSIEKKNWKAIQDEHSRR